MFLKRGQWEPKGPRNSFQETSENCAHIIKTVLLLVQKRHIKLQTENLIQVLYRFH
jgi:hypothetical protein